MTDRFPVPPTDRQRDDLDALLGDLAAGRDGAAGVLDAGLAGTVRLVHHTLSEPVGVDPRERARRWAALSEGGDVRGVSWLARRAPAVRRPAGSTGKSAHPRRLDSRSPIPRLMAVVLGLLLVAGSLATILVGGRNEAPPTMIPAAWVATPASTPSGPAMVEVELRPGVTTTVQAVQPLLQTCTVAPLTVDDLASRLGVETGVNGRGTPTLVRPSGIPAVRLPDTLRPLSEGLRAGTTLPGGLVDIAVRDQVVAAWSGYRSCLLSRTMLRAFTYLSDDGIYRVYQASNAPLAAFFGNVLDEERPGDRLPRFDGVPDEYLLGELRSQPDGSIVGVILVYRGYGQPQPFWEVAGLVRFVASDGGWRVDEYGIAQG